MKLDHCIYKGQKFRQRFWPKSQRILNIFENDQKVKKKIKIGTFFLRYREKVLLYF